jgi:hypothetical protein
MHRICMKCGGLLVGQWPMDFYQARHWKCVNCGWPREETHAYLDQATSSRRYRVSR